MFLSRKEILIRIVISLTVLLQTSGFIFAKGPGYLPPAHAHEQEIDSWGLDEENFFLEEPEPVQPPLALPDQVDSLLELKPGHLPSVSSASIFEPEVPSVSLHTKNSVETLRAEEVIVTPAGGTIQLSNGRVLLVIDEGTFENDVKIVLRPIVPSTLGNRAVNEPLFDQNGELIGMSGKHTELLRYQLEAFELSSGDSIKEFDKPIHFAADAQSLYVIEEGEQWTIARQNEDDNLSMEYGEVTVHNEAGILSMAVSEPGILSINAGEPPVSWRYNWIAPTVSEFSGAATYEFPVELPPGRNSLQPDLTIRYSSRGLDAHTLSPADQGPLGLGFSMSEISIKRTNIRVQGQNYFEVIYYDGFALNLNGQNHELKFVSSSGNTARYVAVNAPGLFIERIYDPGLPAAPAANEDKVYWVVKTPDGATYRLGYTANSAQGQWVSGTSSQNGMPASLQEHVFAGAKAGWGVMSWYVDTVTDVHGNQMQYDYHEPYRRQQEWYDTYLFTEIRRLKEIRYNYATLAADPNSSLSGTFPTDFASKVVFDINPSQNNRIDAIKIYHLAYLNGSLPYRVVDIGLWINPSNGLCGQNTQTERINSIEVQGYDHFGNLYVLPKTTFTYETWGHGWIDDIDGDGQEESERCYRYDYLKSVNNGYGGSITFDYASDGRLEPCNGCAPPSEEDPGAPWNYIPSYGSSYYVTKVTSNDGINPDAVTEYQPSNPCYDQISGDMGDLPGATNCPTRLNQANYTSGGLVGFANTIVVRHDFNVGGQMGPILNKSMSQFHLGVRAMGRPLWIEQFDVNDFKFQRQDFFYISDYDNYGQVFDSLGNEFVYTYRECSTSYVQGGQSTQHCVDYEYDRQNGIQYGNQTAVTEEGFIGGVANQKRMVVREYYPNNTTWIVSAVARETVYVGTAGVTIDPATAVPSSDVRNYYNYSNSYTTPPTKGIVTEVERMLESGAVSLPLSPAVAPPPEATCVDLTNVSAGASAEGVGTIHPSIDISSTGDVVVIHENSTPAAYVGNGINNGGLGANGGFSDISKVHDYAVDMAPGATAGYFSLRMLDFGDYTANLETLNQAALVAFDMNNNVVASDILQFNSDGTNVNPNSSIAGDLSITGDAVTAADGQAGNYTFKVYGTDIVRVEIRFSNDLGPGSSDPNIGFTDLCFVETSPPSLPTNTPTPTPTATVFFETTPTATATATSTPTATATNTPIATPTNTPGSGGSVTFTATNDAAVLSNRPSDNYGGSTTLSTDASPVINSYLQFDMQGVTGAVTNATLRLYLQSNSSTGLNIYEVADNNWQENTITYSNAPTMGSLINNSGGLTANNWVDIDVTSYVAGNGLVSFALASSDSNRLNLSSSEGANAPQLVITSSGSAELDKSKDVVVKRDALPMSKTSSTMRLQTQTGNPVYAVVQTMLYDAYGNVLEVTDANARTTTTDYDNTYNLYPVSVTNDKGQTQQFHYSFLNSIYNVNLINSPGLLREMIDANSEWHFTYYDVFGRLLEVYHGGDAQGPDNGVAERYTYNDGPNAELPFLITSWKRTADGWFNAGVWEWQYFDGFGKLIQTQRPHTDWYWQLVQAGDYFRPRYNGQVVLTDYTYNSLGNQTSESVPYFKLADPDEFVYFVPDTTQGKIVTNYSAAGQAVRTVGLDGAVMSTVFGNNSVWGQDGNNHIKASYFDNVGQLFAVDETVDVFSDTFDSTSMPDWTTVGGVTASGGIGRITGDNTWGNYISHNLETTGDGGVAFSFRSSNANITSNMMLAYGSYGTSNYRRWALTTRGGRMELEEWEWGTVAATDLMQFNANTWYRAVLRGAQSGAYMTLVVWEAGNPANSAEIRLNKDSTWKESGWRFTAQVFTDNATLELDNYDELNFNRTRYTYDLLGNLTSVTDPMGHVTTMVYDAASRKRHMSDPDMGEWYYEYDNTGNLIYQTDAKFQTLAFSYDELNRLTEKRLGIGGPLLASYGYDSVANGNFGKGYRTSMTAYNPPGTVSNSASWTYDKLGRVIQENRQVNGGSYTFAFGYTQGNVPVSVTYPGGDSGQLGETVTTDYWWVTGQPKDHVGDGTYVTQANYENPSGQMSQLNLANTSMYINYGYDSAFRLNSIRMVSSGVDRFYQTMNYDKAGNINQIVEYTIPNGPQTQEFGYDSLNRLVSASATGGSVGTYDATYAYDALGNVVQKGNISVAGYGQTSGIAPNAKPHALTHVDGLATFLTGDQRYWYDANGNMVRRLDQAERDWSLGWTPENMLSSAVNTDGDELRFEYDADGMQVLRLEGEGTAAEKTTVILGKLFEHDSNSGYRKQYLFNGQLIAVREGLSAGSPVSFFATDHLGSVTTTLWANGTVRAETRYYPWGQDNRWKVDVTPTGARFTNQRLDDTLNLYNYNARYYDHWIGRFISADTIVPEQKRLSPLTVGFHETTFLSKANEENQQLQLMGPTFAWNNRDKQELGIPSGPSSPQNISRFSYGKSNPIREVDPSGHDSSTSTGTYYYQDLTREEALAFVNWLTGKEGTTSLGFADHLHTWGVNLVGGSLAVGAVTAAASLGTLALPAVVIGGLGALKGEVLKEVAETLIKVADKIQEALNSGAMSIRVEIVDEGIFSIEKIIIWADGIAKETIPFNLLNGHARTILLAWMLASDYETSARVHYSWQINHQTLEFDF